ncbi:MAG: 5-methyltetrahydrofolate--homocysteine methyltransferase [Bacteroidaceae bacterium]|nr:5-methyltetrahydrofolate--homocysteine methyltransferase [Bacteroidaceae bacterium]
MRRALTYTVREVAPYINWLYYFHTWGMEPRFASVADVHNCPSCRATWIAAFPSEEQAKAREAMKLYDEAMELLRQWADEPICHALFLLSEAYSEGDDIVIDGTIRIPFLRQQHAGKKGYTLCLSDFIRETSPLPEQNDRDITNTIGIFATTVSHPSNFHLSSFNFQLSILTDRLAEATAEKLHEEVRKHYWGYAPDERFTMRELHEERFQGIRPAIGYPSLPDQSINFLIDQLLHLSDIGVTLSENGAMHPHSTVSGFMFAHPKAQYFSVGNISEEQLTDYAKRRGIDILQTKKFLTAIIT